MKHTPSLIDYLDWRGDLSFEASPFNDVDALVLCQLSYINFANLAPGDFDSSIRLGEVSKLFFASADFETRSDLGILLDTRTNELLKKAGESVRFGDVELTGFVSEYDKEKEEQFSAVTFVLASGSFLNKQQIFVAFRGTDDTIVGWKEDFNLAFLCPRRRARLPYARLALVQKGGDCRGRALKGRKPRDFCRRAHGRKGQKAACACVQLRRAGLFSGKPGL